jgi:hypothetical protein
MIFRRSGPSLTIFFATDVHGSDLCFKKFVNARKHYGADIMILGGDMTGKMVVPIVFRGNGRYTCNFLGTETQLKTEKEVAELSRRVNDMGYYAHLANLDEIAELRANKAMVNQLFEKKMHERLKQWIDYAEDRLKGHKILIAPGNDDPHAIDAVFARSEVIQVVEGRCVELEGNRCMVSSGWSNPTPWDTPREEPDEQLEKRIRQIIEKAPSMERCIFNLHAPPYNTGLDTGPDLKEDLSVRTAGGAPMAKPVGSPAVRKLVEEYQPMLGLFGHIHEARGTVRMGRTFCVNPGSEYAEGVLRGVLVMLDESTKVRNFPVYCGMIFLWISLAL